MEHTLFVHPFVRSEKVYFKVSLMMLIASILFLIFGYGMVQAIIPVPEPITYFVMVYMYAHVLHFGYGLYRLFYYWLKVQKLRLGIKIYKTVVSILISPISACITWLALFLMIISSCAAQ